MCRSAAEGGRRCRRDATERRAAGAAAQRAYAERMREIRRLIAAGDPEQIAARLERERTDHPNRRAVIAALQTALDQAKPAVTSNDDVPQPKPQRTPTAARKRLEAAQRAAAQQVADLIAAQRAAGKTDAEVAALIAEALTQTQGGSDAVRSVLKDALADLKPATNKTAARKTTRKTTSAPPRETLADLDARLAAARAETARRQAAWEALSEDERQARIAAQWAQIAARDEEARRRSAERRAARLAAMTDAERATFLAREAEDERRWQEMLAAQRARAAEQPSRTWDEDDERYTAPTIPVGQWGAAMAAQSRGDGVAAFLHTAPVQTHAPHTTPVQAPANPWAALRQQAANRDAAIRAARATEQPLSTPEMRTAAEAFDAERLAEGQAVIDRLNAERREQDAEEARRAEEYANTAEGKANPFAVAFAAQRKAAQRQATPRRVTQRVYDPSAPIPPSGHRIPAGSGLPFGGRVMAKLDPPGEQ